jgi:16S rRNA (guanine527-N7)-methyltransferase
MSRSAADKAHDGPDRRTMTAADAHALEATASALGLALDAATRDRLLGFLALLQRWNRTYNLTALRDPAQMLTHHLADCLAVVPPLRRHLAGRVARVLDVGSGAGLPGAVIALLDPALDVTCVDAVGKKAAFVRQVAAELGVPNLHAEHGRVEQGRGRHDVITSRAFATLDDLCRLTRERLAPGGVWMAMKGQRPDDELRALPSDIDVFHVEQLDVPNLDAQRCLVWLRPRAAP